VKADLHMHSTASDGRLHPRQVMMQAHQAGLSLVSLTDHDTVAGWEEASGAASELGLSIITGTEISTREHGREVHLLAYGFDVADAALQAFLTRQQERRNERALAFLERFKKAGLLPAEVALPSAPAGRSWARPHLGAVLVEHGAVSDMNEAFARYLSPGCTLFVEKPMPGGREVMDVVHGAGGRVFLAHPGHHVPHAILLSLVRQGLDGIEVVHPSHDPMLRRYYREVAERFGLLKSGGSDFHGRTNRGEPPLGETWLTPDTSLLDALRTH
jgi:predicted metal-dependent phosphoesterase TrpH